MTDADNIKALLALCDKDSMIEYVARAIAQNGFGRSWVDFQESDIGDTDQNDLKEYAQAAIEAIEVRVPLSEQAILASCNAALDECAELTDADIKLIAAWTKQHLLSSASRPTEREVELIRSRHKNTDFNFPWVREVDIESPHALLQTAHRDRGTLLRLLETRTAGVEPLTAAVPSREQTFRTGDVVTKTRGYKFTGPVVAAFLTLKGEERFVVDNGDGLMHIFNADQLALLNERVKL